jgi:hypothetical protein
MLAGLLTQATKNPRPIGYLSLMDMLFLEHERNRLVFLTRQWNKKIIPLTVGKETKGLMNMLLYIKL